MCEWKRAKTGLLGELNWTFVLFCIHYPFAALETIVPALRRLGCTLSELFKNPKTSHFQKPFLQGSGKFQLHNLLEVTHDTSCVLGSNWVITMFFSIPCKAIWTFRIGLNKLIFIVIAIPCHVLAISNVFFKWLHYKYVNWTKYRLIYTDTRMLFNIPRTQVFCTNTFKNL